MSNYKWVKGFDFIDNSARYSIEGKDPSDSLEDITVLVYIDNIYDYMGKRKVYIASVQSRIHEAQDTIQCQNLKDAKIQAEKLYEEYLKNF